METNYGMWQQIRICLSKLKQEMKEISSFNMVSSSAYVVKFHFGIQSIDSARKVLLDSFFVALTTCQNHSRSAASFIGFYSYQQCDYPQN